MSVRWACVTMAMSVALLVVGLWHGQPARSATQQKFLGDSKQCTKCHPNDGQKHLPYFNGWKETLHAKQQPKDDEPVTMIYRKVTGFSLKGETADWLEDGVGCESCHGPNADHAATKTREEALKTTYAGKFGIEPKGNDLAHNPFPPDEIAKAQQAAMMCGQCHAVWVKDGKEVPPAGFDIPPTGPTDLFKLAQLGKASDSLRTRQYGEWYDSPHYKKGVWCATCHDPHAKNHRVQLRKPVNELCSTCHQNEKDIAKHVQEMAQKHIPDVKVKVTPDMECVPCHMPNHSHRMTNQEAADYMKANKDKLSQ
ncbi:MAG: hypothetical protein OXFUSZZB_001036 [Candidatus Fervidibacter sp.]|jgi:predicted CXXCH cytochrome family protein